MRPLKSTFACTLLAAGELPPPDPKFGGHIKETAHQSKQRWATRVSCRPRTRRPTSCFIITDDSGFGVPGTFGGVIPTPV